MMSILTLAVLIVLVVTMRSPGGARAKPPASKPGEGDRVILGKGVKLGPPREHPTRPGVVTYALMKDKKLPSPTQRIMRRALRPLSRAGSWVYRRFVPPKHDEPTADGRIARGQRQSAELQNFLDARNREIARRKSEGDKPGPDDRLH